ncbi:hypothetical protein Dda_2956 [Drechslerella dactyloides]|uniref:Uncharacterized protein n=1 Tax=Drechslerella dactyloides TaxID=74499 RepID=A0AAD6NJV9_DREDA|nr:hypothetical protein Dda_2956 [Drechslerella dactyloides]
MPCCVVVRRWMAPPAPSSPPIRPAFLLQLLLLLLFIFIFISISPPLPPPPAAALPELLSVSVSIFHRHRGPAVAGSLVPRTALLECAGPSSGACLPNNPVLKQASKF